MELAIFVDGAEGEELAKRTRQWRKRLLDVVSNDGAMIHEGPLEALYGDVATQQTRNAMWRKDSGVTFQKQSNDDYALKNAAGDVLLTLPPLAGRAVQENPERYGPQIRLLAAGMSSEDPKVLLRLAMNVFSNLHEKEHEAMEQRLLYAPTESRANAFVDGLASLQNAKTDAEKEEAAAVIRTALFAEAAPKNRLAYLGLDLFTPIGNVNAASEFKKEAVNAYENFHKGEVLGGSLHTMWAAIELAGAVSGIRAGQLVRQAARTTPQGRAIVAARDSARMQASAQRRHAPVAPQVIIGRGRWEQMDDDQKAYFKGLLANAAGQVGEAQMTQTLTEAGVDSFKRQELLKKERGEKPTPPDKNPTRYEVLGKQKGGTRIFDDAAVGQTIESFMGLFSRPKLNEGKTTVFEHKGLGATKSKNQIKLENEMKGNGDKYGHVEIATLHTPYSDYDKKALRDTIVKKMSNPKLQGQKYISQGVYRKNFSEANQSPRLIRWSEDDLDKMIRSTERSLTLQSWGDKAPTLGDFFMGVAARLSTVDDDGLADEQLPMAAQRPEYQQTSESEFND